MPTPVIEIILTPSEWDVLRALNEVGTLTSTRVVHEKLNDVRVRSSRTHLLLGNLAAYGLATRHDAHIDGPFGLVHNVLWEVSPMGKQLFS